MYKRKFFAGIILTGMMMLPYAGNIYAAPPFIKPPVEADVSFGPGVDTSNRSNTANTENVGKTNNSDDAWSGYTHEDGSNYRYVERGVSISKFQNLKSDIDWNKVKNSGINFAIIRVAYGLNKDAYFESNMQGANSAGIKTGVYLCSTATNMAEAVAEANLTVEAMKGMPVNYPVAYDVEVRSIINSGVSRDELTAMVNEYCRIVENAGYKALVYANKTWLTKYMDVGSIPYDIWYARYAEDKVYRPLNQGNITIWQSGSKGIVPGIAGTVTTEFAMVNYGDGGNSKASNIEGGDSNYGPGVTAPANKASENSSNNISNGPNVKDGISNGPVIDGETSTGPLISDKKDINNAAINASKQKDGWVNEDGLWFYNRSGNLLTGWQSINNFWFYFDKNAVMKTSWQLINDKWYYLGNSGVMKTSWIKLGDSWFYMDATGAMVTGWLEYNGNKYYLDSNGYMQASKSITIDNKEYKFDESGALIK